MRRTVCAIVFACFALPAAADELRSAFYALPKPERVELQTHLADLGLYTGAIDGLWGPRTAGAFEQVQSSLAWPAHREMALAMGATAPSQALWAYVSDPDLAASLPSWR